MPVESDRAHGAHDPQVIAALGSGDLSVADALKAEAWLRDCHACAELRDDLATLAAALSSLPKTTPAPRDFRLTAAQAARLRGGPWWRRIARSIAAPRGLGRPLATAFTTLGLVGLLLGSLPLGALLPAGATGERSLAVDTTSGAGAPEASGATPESDSNQQVPAAQGSDGRGADLYGAASSPGVPKDDRATDQVSSQGHDAGTPSSAPIFALALTFLAVGLGLFAVRRFGRRLA